MRAVARARTPLQRGFTLVEMLTTVLIIAVLAAIVIPMTLGQRQLAVDGRTTSDVRNLATWQAILVEQTGTGAPWATGTPLPVTLAGYSPSTDTTLVVSTVGDTWCVSGWAAAGNRSTAAKAIWSDSTSRAVSKTAPATPACAALLPAAVLPPVGGGGGGGGGGVAGGSFARAVYSLGSVSFTNAWTIAGINADLYVGGNFDCNSNVRITGSVTVIGNASITNSCQIDGELWVGGTLTMSANGLVKGNAMVVGDVSMTTSTTIGGNLSTQGSVAFSTKPKVNGNVLAAGPVSIADANSQQVGGDIRTQSTFSSNKDALGRAAVQAIVVGGAIFDNIATAVTVTPPPAVKLPPAPYMPAQWTGFSTSTWVQWLNQNAAANGAPAWSTLRTATPGCVAAGAGWGLKGPLTISTNTLIDARQVSSGCSKITFQGVDLVMSADLVVYADSIETVSGWQAKSADGAIHTLRLIVPGLTPECGSGRDITIGNGSTLAPEIQTLLYSPAAVTLSGASALWGQVVAGCVASSGQVTINYQGLTLPGWGS